MKLWEVKAQSLRLMFADTDIEFSESEFQTQVIYQNANTREKLVRMNDSIKRAIDLYYQYNGEKTKMTTKTLDSSVVGGNTIYYNTINLSSTPSDFNTPTRVDVIANLSENIGEANNVSFDFDEANKKIVFIQYDFTHFTNKITFRIYYKTKNKNIVGDENEMTFDLNTLDIAEDVQRQIPLYVKSELYQEDEPNMAQQAKQEFIQFLILNQRKQFTKANSKVRKTFNRNFDV